MNQLCPSVNQGNLFSDYRFCPVFFERVLYRDFVNEIQCQKLFFGQGTPPNLTFNIFCYMLLEPRLSLGRVDSEIFEVFSQFKKEFGGVILGNVVNGFCVYY